MAQVDATVLRGLLYGPLNTGTHEDITKTFEALGLHERRPESGQRLSKADRVASVLAAAQAEELQRIAEAFVAGGSLDAELRNEIQDVLWAGQGPRMWERTRRTLAAALDIDDLVVDSDRFEAMLDRWWVLGTPSPFDGFFSSSDTSVMAQVFGPGSGSDRLRKDIHQHVFRNRDWSTVHLFEKLGAFDAVDRRFLGFVEDLVSYRVVIEEANQRRIAAAMTPALREAGMELRETGIDNGYPEFRIVSSSVPRTRPKTVIFGSDRKPDLRVSDTVDSEIEIVDARGSLVYDDPIGPAGLRWQDLQAWWRRHHPHLDDNAAKKALFNRLKYAVPEDSPPQRRLFELYHDIHREQIPSLPALLPEVWLHWDHKTVHERGAGALLGQRMDFLLLAPNHHRIVLEVDGVTHYTDNAGKPSPSRYARNTALDRDLQLRGYTVYRFGAAELSADSDPTPMLTQFFHRMFTKHGVVT